MKWPACGAANCGAEATWVDSCGVGWCESHQDSSLTGELRIAESTDDFDPEWLAGIPGWDFGNKQLTGQALRVLECTAKAALDEVERLRAALEGERAAVVAWLRVPCGAHYFADAIERGDHILRGEVTR